MTKHSNDGCTTAPHGAAWRTVLRTLGGVVLLIVFETAVMHACPNCKEATMADTGANAGAGFSSSILFMMTMPFLVLGALTLRIWMTSRKHAARARG